MVQYTVYIEYQAGGMCLYLYLTGREILRPITQVRMYLFHKIHLVFFFHFTYTYSVVLEETLLIIGR